MRIVPSPSSWMPRFVDNMKQQPSGLAYPRGQFFVDAETIRSLGYFKYLKLLSKSILARWIFLHFVAVVTALSVLVLVLVIKAAHLLPRSVEWVEPYNLGFIFVRRVNMKVYNKS
jgi:hypothetical protein